MILELLQISKGEEEEPLQELGVRLCCSRQDVLPDLMVDSPLCSLLVKGCKSLYGIEVA